jgi:hypothetical protein
MFKTPILVVMGLQQRLEYAERRSQEFDNEKQKMRDKKYDILEISPANRTAEDQHFLDTYNLEMGIKVMLENTWIDYQYEQEHKPEEELAWPNEGQIEAEFRADWPRIQDIFNYDDDD